LSWCELGLCIRVGNVHYALGGLVTAFVVFVERGQRKILVNYAKRQVGNKIYGGQSSHLPLKLNMSGVIPPIFASSIILFPGYYRGWFGSSDSMRWLKDLPGGFAWAAYLCHAVRGGDCFLLFLLYGAGFQFEGNSRQPEEEWRVCSWDSAR
jgi:preprotein translocase subunit SecY